MIKQKAASAAVIAIIVVALALVVGGFFLIRQETTTPQINNTQNNQQNSVITENAVVDANNLFAMDLYSKYKPRQGNVFFSPYSISSALAMTYEGAKGKTAEEMQTVLHFPIDSDTRRNEFSQINSQINGVNKPYALTTANALWAQKDYPFSQDYLNVVEQNYGGKATNLDFETNADGSREIINGWVENKTNNKIKDLIPPGTITPLTRLVLTNAIYFKANWTSQFEKEATYDQDFKMGDTTAKVPTMHQQNYFNYSETDNLQILEMDYLGNDLSMLIILPKENNLKSVENIFSKAKFNEWKEDMEIQEVRVTLPKFKMETKYLMAGDLISMGMPTAFSGDADFTGITSVREQFSISQVIHQAFVNVTESGTEAAAATAVVMAGSAPGQTEEPKIFNADHPFIFVIQQKDTGNILFMGRVSDPTKQ